MSRKIILPLIVVFAACVSSAPPPETISQTVPRLLQESGVPGAAVALVDGSDVRALHFGVTNVETGQPVNDETIFEAASLSKPVFALAVMQLVDQGKLDLDQRLATLVAEPFLQDPRGATITARMVLTHHSGLPNWRPRGKDLELVFEPATRFSYSGEGFVYLQRAVESITGEPLDTVMRRLVFEPLGMTRSSYAWQAVYDESKAWGHNPIGESPDWRKSDEVLSAATLHTTAEDLGKFLSAVLTAQRLSRAAHEEMLTPHVAAPLDCANCSRRSERVPDSKEISWGLGWGLVKSAGAHDIWHWGDNGDFKAYIYGDPQERRGVVVLTNGASGLSIAGEIAVLAMAGTDEPQRAQAPLDWTKYARWDAPSNRALHRLAREGVSALDWLGEQPLSESEMNELGYALMRTARNREALAVFRLNAERHPDSWNAWDSLGEGYISAGDRKQAQAAYSESVRLKRDSPSGLEALRILAGEEKLDSTLLSKITGGYHSEHGSAEIRHDDGALQLVLDGEVYPLIVLSPGRFIGKSEVLRVEVNGEGQLTILRGGERLKVTKQSE